MACVSLKISSRSRFIFSSSIVFSATTSPSGLHSARLFYPTPHGSESASVWIMSWRPPRDDMDYEEDME